MTFKINYSNSINEHKLNFFQRYERINWLLVGLITALATIGFSMLYSAGGGLYPWLVRQLAFFIIFLPIMIIIAITDLKIWFKASYLLYFIALTLVIIVDIMGHNAMGATRWFRLGPITIQPSEIMKICTIFALARYFYTIDADNVLKIKFLIIPSLIIAIPGFFIFHQPDLGTATILVAVGVSILFLAGVKIWKFISIALVGIISIPFAWHFLLYDYQKKRVLNFINPNNDPLGSGYNIIQSKIAIGSGGLFGKGFMNGTQGQLDFLPEKQTDFIFTMLCEELGFIGAIVTILIYFLIIIVSINIALKTRHQYGRLLVMGVVNIFFVHMFVNMGMVMGLIPVVGAPLPFVSYGGTIMASMMIGFGLVLNVDISRDFDAKNLH